LPFSKELIRTMDPYVVVKVGDTEFKSKVAKHGGQNPKWDEFFEFKLENADGKDKVTFEVFDQELISHAKVGRLDIPLALLTEHSGKTEAVEFQLNDFSDADKSAGYIRFKVKWHAHKSD